MREKRIVRIIENLNYYSETFASLPVTNLNEVGRVAVALISSILSYQVAVVLFIEDEGGEPRLLASKGINQDSLDAWNSQETLIRHLLGDINISKVFECETLNESIGSSARRLGLCDMFIAAPLIAREHEEERIGFVIAACPGRNCEPDCDIIGLEIIAGIITGAITNCIGRTKLLEANERIQGEMMRRKQAEEALQESEAQYRETLDAMGDWILAVDPDLRIVLFNETFMQINKQLGLTTDVIGRTPTEIFPFLPDTLLDEYRWVFENKRVLITQEKTKVGSREFITESRKIPLLKEGRIVRVISVIRDITEQKRLEAQLRQAQKMEAMGTLAGGVAHDLNNILAGIVSYPDVLLMQIPEESPLRGPITTMKESGKKAADIVQDLLTLARRGVATTEVANLNDIISGYLKSPEHQKLKLYHAKVEVETTLATDLFNILGSPVHLSKVAMNLISNAAEAMPDAGKVLISTENRYIDRPVRGYDDVDEGDYVTLTVSDSGVGISSEDLGRVFEPFYTKKKMRRSGTGLGMAVVWGTVKDHNGYIDVQSAEGQGTTITVYFPATRQHPVKDEPGLAIEDYMGSGQSILVVDDVKEQREIAFTILSELGYSVTLVSSGEEAVEYMKTSSVDLLLLDMIMDPGVDGLDTYKQILELHPRQKAIITSGFSETDRVKEAQKLGAGQYIKKPYTLEKIGIAVKAELEK